MVENWGDPLGGGGPWIRLLGASETTDGESQFGGLRVSALYPLKWPSSETDS